ncbi:tripartite tricarboxylate transporter substrate binding protein [Bacillus mesophilum]|uniref:Tripartite tricarboxylate transporter substrate binding protein n=1 Tax=Bacillus mesophilum TaxID=1071718 RepID=A0A7V7RKG0_9BACI|nr:tripartite tricarboxylate transporter substrate-binding protein [Bacillus mesophilum]KAB2331789.1 tripartite tricarboxylate transporter substrate binding protein [Bacillus mesophilum]
MKKRFCLYMMACAAVFLSACSGKEVTGVYDDNGWRPNNPIEVVATAGAGGGWDTTARMAAQTFEKEGIIEERLPVINKPGGGGAVGWAYMTRKEGNPHNIFVTSPPILLVPLNGQSKYGYEDFTPLANMIADYAAFAVRADAKWDTLNDLFDDMKKDPSSVSVVGVSSPGSMDHIQFIKIARAAGVDVTKIKYVSDQDGGALTQLLNGSVDVYSAGTSETVEQVRSGKIKVLGITAPERLEGETLEDFPTAVEQGIDETFVNWRGFFGPAGMDEQQIQYYQEKFKQLNDSPEWKKIREKYGWNELYMAGDEYEQFLDEQNEEMYAILEELKLLR